MAVPARHTSKQKKRSRRGHIKLNVPAMHYDATTGEYRLSHRVSPKGYYKGRQVVNNNDNSNNQLKDTFDMVSFFIPRKRKNK